MSWLRSEDGMPQCMRRMWGNKMMKGSVSTGDSPHLTHFDTKGLSPVDTLFSNQALCTTPLLIPVILSISLTVIPLLLSKRKA